MFTLLALLDDIAMTLDDVAVMTKVAVQKTSVLMSDDLAVNAGVVQGVNPDRELPIVKAIFLGSLINKVISISGVLFLMAVYPRAINWVMFVGGLFLSYEGAHKILNTFFNKNKDSSKKAAKPISEKDKIRGAIRTDLILSIEIMVIAKSTLSGSFLNQTLTLIVVGLLASVLIYGLVAIIVKVDDFGLYMVKKGKESLGMALVRSMPYFMRALSVIGTIAMLLVGGGIIVHIFHLHHYLNEHLQNLIIGFVLGLICCAILKTVDMVFKTSLYSKH